MASAKRTATGPSAAQITAPAGAAEHPHPPLPGRLLEAIGFRWLRASRLPPAALKIERPFPACRYTNARHSAVRGKLGGGPWMCDDPRTYQQAFTPDAALGGTTTAAQQPHAWICTRQEMIARLRAQRKFSSSVVRRPAGRRVRSTLCGASGAHNRSKVAAA